MNKPLEIYELCNIIKGSVPKTQFTVIGEVSGAKLYHQTLYFNLKDNMNLLNCILFSSKTIKNINNGDKIVCSGVIDYYSRNGKLSFKIDKIISIEGTGEMYKIYQEYMLQCESLGYFDKPKTKLKLPIKNVLFVTSKSGAAIQDIIYNLNINKSKVKYDICNVSVQGNNCPRDIIKELKYKDNLGDYDIIIITRGGGSFEDLIGFSHPKLIKFIYEFDYPVLSAIGHMIDNPLLDKVANFNVPTPSLAAQFIIDHNKNYCTELNSVKYLLEEKIKYTLNMMEKNINMLQNKLSIHSLFLENTITFMKDIIRDKLDNIENNINMLKNKLNIVKNYNNSISVLFGKKKYNTMNKIEKKLKSNKPITIIINNIKIILTDYEYDINYH